MPVILHRATRTDLLAEGLARVLAVPLDDPFVQELVVVPAKGVERWLTQRLSHRLGASTGAGGAGEDGVCAGVRFLRPNSLITLLLGTDRDDPWLPEQLVWPLLAELDAALGEPWAAPLARHLGYGDDSPEGRLRAGRRYAVARRLAGLFHSYAEQRPELLTGWEQAGAQGPWSDGAGGPLDPDLAWQPRLWQSLVARVGGPTPGQRLREALRALRERPEEFDLPPRLSLFGPTRLAAGELELLDALGGSRDVHLWLPHPSPALWDELTGQVSAGRIRRSADRSVLTVANPLLASLGRDVRELQRGLAATRWQPAPDPVSPQVPPSTWLQWVQDDLRQNRLPNAAQAAARGIHATDRSIQVHACHGPARQVEVLREVLLGLLADDPTLEPRDILVMCPDIDSFAPLIQAAFGLAYLSLGGAAHPGHLLRVQLADRSLTATNPLLAIAARLVELAGGRITASELLDLAGEEPVRRRFRFDEDDLDRLSSWVDQAVVRWGLDESHRAEFGLAGESANTWRTGMDRLLLGVARSEEPDREYAGILPLDDVDSGSIDLAGRAAEFLDRIAALREAVASAVHARDWMTAISCAIDSLTEVPFADLWQRAELERELTLVTTAADGTLPLAHSDIRALLSGRLSGRPTRANFRTGSLTVSTMTPMRSVPHRVIALLGLDDGVFPRTNSPDGDDVLARSPLTGERDPRSEDRQLLLDAILAAGETLVVTYSGADPHTGARRPPAVPLGELLDAARASAGIGTLPAPPATGEQAAVPPLRRHPLQPFDEANLASTAGGMPFTFDPHAVAAARALAAARAGDQNNGDSIDEDQHHAPLPASTTGLRLPGLLPARPQEEVTLADLQSFFANPTRAFLRDRLDIASPLEDSLRADGIPIELDGLERWQIGERLLRARLQSQEIPAIERAERQRGELPPAGLGMSLLRELGPGADAIAQAADRLLPGAFANPARSVDVDVDLGGGRRLIGTVDQVRDRAYVVPTFSKLSGKHRLQAWIALLALSAGTPASAGPWTAHAVGRGRSDGQVWSRGPIDPGIARTFLLELVEVRDLGLRMPLAFSAKASYDYAEQLHNLRGRREKLALDKARKTFEEYNDNNDASIALLYGPRPSLDIWLDAPAEEEVWQFAAEAESLPSRFGHTAMRVWRPALLAGGRR